VTDTSLFNPRLTSESIAGNAFTFHRNDESRAGPWGVYHMYRDLASEAIDIAHEVERRKMNKLPLLSSVLQDTRSWRLIHNAEDEQYSKANGFLLPGQCYEKVAMECTL
jgi:hypothetical protein